MPGRRGLHAGLIKAPSRRSPAAPAVPGPAVQPRRGGDDVIMGELAAAAAAAAPWGQHQNHAAGKQVRQLKKIIRAVIKDSSRSTPPTRARHEWLDCMMA